MVYLQVAINYNLFCLSCITVVAVQCIPDGSEGE